MSGRGLAAALALAIGALPVIPPEHVHHRDDDGRHHNLVHRHATLHTSHRHTEPHQVRIDDDDAPVLTLDAVFTVTPIVRAPMAVQTSTVMLDPPRIVLTTRAPGFFERLIHGPPRAPASLRAPPLATFL